MNRKMQFSNLPESMTTALVAIGFLSLVFLLSYIGWFA